MKTISTRCLYCGKLGPWWECDCPAVKEVKAGTRMAPRVVRIDGQMVIVADEETVEANHFNLQRYRSRAKQQEPTG